MLGTNLHIFGGNVKIYICCTRCCIVQQHFVVEVIPEIIQVSGSTTSGNNNYDNPKLDN